MSVISSVDTSLSMQGCFLRTRALFHLDLFLRGGLLSFKLC
jgi:hypothetical protein